MFRNLSRLFVDSLPSNGFNISPNPVCVQTVRWRRKPRWKPIAKSKMFRIPERHVLPEGEEKEWRRLNNNYKTQMRSVRMFLREEVAAKKAAVQAAATPADEEAEYQRCAQLNDNWNLEISKIRNARIEKENAERRSYILQRIEDKKVRDSEEIERIEARVKREREAVSTFITRETIDKAIEEALANPTDYNFAIDLQGNQLKQESPDQNEKKI